MRVAVISPFHAEAPETIQRCIDSVVDQTYPSAHILVGDGADKPDVSLRGTQLIQLPVAHGDYGDTPRLIGSVSAATQGYDAICWLDADNWYEPDHVERLVTLARQECAQVVTATRNLRRLDGSLLDVCTESDGANFNDTNCYLITAPFLHVAAAWGFKDRRAATTGDRIVWRKVCEEIPNRVHCSTPTVNYTTSIACHYLDRGELPPIGAKVIFTPTGSTFPISVPFPEFQQKYMQG